MKIDCLMPCCFNPPVECSCDQSPTCNFCTFKAGFPPNKETLNYWKQLAKIEAWETHVSKMDTEKFVKDRLKDWEKYNE